MDGEVGCAEDATEAETWLPGQSMEKHRLPREPREVVQSSGCRVEVVVGKTGSQKALG